MIAKADYNNSNHTIRTILEQSLLVNELLWLYNKLDMVIQNKSAKDLFIIYSLIQRKIKNSSLFFDNSSVSQFIKERNITTVELTRIYVLITVLKSDRTFFTSKIKKMFETSDTNELSTLLRYLILFPNPEDFLEKAVDAIRTNIADVFDAIVLNNPYPSCFFNELQWNQAYLKTEFMGREVSKILNIDKRSNKTLTRIISDYAHERWSAGREVNPMFWRPITKFIDDNILKDLEKLLQGNKKEQKAATLCCYYSGNIQANKLLQPSNENVKLIENGGLSWKQLAIL